MCQGKLSSMVIFNGNTLMYYVVSVVMAANLTRK